MVSQDAGSGLESMLQYWLTSITNRENLSNEQRDNLRNHAMKIAKVIIRVAEEGELMDLIDGAYWGDMLDEDTALKDSE